MIKCEECGKKLGIIEGYRHPTMGKKYLLCSSCFDNVEISVEKWREFVISNSFNKSSVKRCSKLGWKKMIPGLPQLKD